MLATSVAPKGEVKHYMDDGLIQRPGSMVLDNLFGLYDVKYHHMFVSTQSTYKVTYNC